MLWETILRFLARIELDEDRMKIVLYFIFIAVNFISMSLFGFTTVYLSIFSELFYWPWNKHEKQIFCQIQRLYTNVNAWYAKLFLMMSVYIRMHWEKQANFSLNLTEVSCSLTAGTHTEFRQNQSTACLRNSGQQYKPSVQSRR